MIQRLLIANRGEIAVRIIRACRELGIETVAVYSEADADARHVREADIAVAIGPAPARESYLAVAKIIAAARATGAQAVHPGYGFLSERAPFARACEEAGLIFVGPPASALEKMGSKIGARRLMAAAGVPIVPGETPADQSDGSLRTTIERVGYPALIKPAAGGGGIGMKVVRGANEIADALTAARREARASFGDDTLYVERLIERPRHVEIQVFADAHGHTVHLFERECSAQRRQQKTVEESPCTALGPAVRERMGAAAIAAATAVGYRNAGTCEFLLEGSGDTARFYFLEMNTRLQVEHGVTEDVTGVDIVKTQIRLAAGEKLSDVLPNAPTVNGHAIEARVYAEDPKRFFPSPGKLEVFRPPVSESVRIETGYREGLDVTPYYDPLLAKVIVKRATRDRAIDDLIEALGVFEVRGVKSNIPALVTVLGSDEFRSGHVHTGLVGELIK